MPTMGSISAAKKLHAVLIPFPIQGHIKPMMKVAKLLYTNGFRISFVNTEYNHRRLIKSRGPDSVKGLPSFQFETIPDGLPPSDADATQDIPALYESLSKNALAPFRNLLAKLNENNSSSSNIPPVSCIVSDGTMAFINAAAQELGIPGVLFWTASPCAYLAHLKFPQLIDKGITPLKDASLLTNGFLDTVVDWIPGLEGIRWRDFPSFFRSTNPDDYILKYIVQDVEGTHEKASAIILNSFEELEPNVLNALSAYLPPIYCIGPLQLLENQVDDQCLTAIGSNLWKQEPECIAWLDSKDSNSVVYVNFGSITVVTYEQLVEFAWGLANSNQNFLWIIRPDLVSGESAILPPELVEETKGRGLFASWCDQEQVLSHPSIGGFLTHCGWNSTLESIVNGVPMICWPFFADQLTNCWCSCNKWGIGMEINSDVKRSEVANLVRELMVAVKGKMLKKNAMDLKRLAQEATKNASGSSQKNLENLIQNVLISPNYNYQI